MEPSRQKAIDYLMGNLTEEDRIAYESLLESDNSTRLLVSEISDDWSSLALLSSPASPDSDMRSRTLMLTQEATDLSGFFESDTLGRLRDNYTKPNNRYLGGEGSVETSGIRNSSLKDSVYRTYEYLLGILPLVQGDAAAAFGEYLPLQNYISSRTAINQELTQWTEPLSPGVDPVDHSVQRSLLASLPSLAHFLELAGSGKVALSDVRRIFYLCRDQLKIMRASFADLDPQRLADDELIRIHGSHLLRQKWTGARHAFFGSKGTANCGNFFEGPISERCVEFAEYDSNLYCLANLLASRSSHGGFQLELIKDEIPGCVLAVAHAKVNSTLHEQLNVLSGNHSTRTPTSLAKDSCLWSLLQGSMSRGFPHHSIGELADASFFGKQRIEDESYLWFAWPEIENAQEGALASTAKPGQ